MAIKFKVAKNGDRESIIYAPTTAHTYNIKYTLTIGQIDILNLHPSFYVN